MQFSSEITVYVTVHVFKKSYLLQSGIFFTQSNFRRAVSVTVSHVGLRGATLNGATQMRDGVVWW